MHGKSRKELALGIVFILVAILVLTELLNLKSESQELPKLCAYGILFVGVCTILQTLVKARKSADEHEKVQDDERKKNFEILGFCLVLMVTALLIPIIGFYPLTFVFLASLYLFLARPITRKVVRDGLVFGISVIAFFYVVFDMLMKLPVPMGLVF